MSDDMTEEQRALSARIREEVREEQEKREPAPIGAIERSRRLGAQKSKRRERRRAAERSAARNRR